MGSAAATPASYILPTILPNGDVWVGSITSKRLYKLNPENLGGPALAEVVLDFYPYIVVNDGTYVYAGNERGVIKKIDLTTLAITAYCTLPGGGDGKYEQGILKDGILYVGDNKMQGITVYDFIAKSFIETWPWSGIINKTKLFPWHVIDSKNISCYEDAARRAVVVTKPDLK